MPREQCTDNLLKLLYFLGVRLYLAFDPLPEFRMSKIVQRECLVPKGCSEHVGVKQRGPSPSKLGGETARRSVGQMARKNFRQFLAFANRMSMARLDERRDCIENSLIGREPV